MPDLTPVIRHPARFVPLAAVATEGADGAALPVSPSNPIPVLEASYVAARALVEDTAVEPGKALLVDCSQGGVLNFELADTTQLPLTFAPGVTLLPFPPRGACRAHGSRAAATSPTPSHRSRPVRTSLSHAACPIRPARLSVFAAPPR